MRKLLRKRILCRYSAHRIQRVETVHRVIIRDSAHNKAATQVNVHRADRADSKVSARQDRDIRILQDSKVHAQQDRDIRIRQGSKVNVQQDRDIRIRQDSKVSVQQDSQQVRHNVPVVRDKILHRTVQIHRHLHLVKVEQAKVKDHIIQDRADSVRQELDSSVLTMVAQVRVVKDHIIQVRAVKDHITQDRAERAPEHQEVVKAVRDTITIVDHVRQVLETTKDLRATLAARDKDRVETIKDREMDQEDQWNVAGMILRHQRHQL